MLKSFYTILLVSLSTFAAGQPIQDTTFLRVSVLKAEKAYHDALSKQHNIYNGRGYKAYTPTADEHPYFLTDDWVLGTIVYESDYYAEVPLLYDLASEKVISENPANGAKMELVYNKIDRFEIREHIFIHLYNNSAFAPDMSEGFYEILYDGKLKLYAQRKKNFQTRTKGTIMYPDFEEKNKYFLFNGNSFARVTGNKSIIKAIGSKEKLPKPTGIKIDPNTSNKLEDKLKLITKFYDLHSPTL